MSSRPRAGAPATNVVAVRLTEQELRVLDSLFDSSRGETRGDAIRLLVRGAIGVNGNAARRSNSVNADGVNGNAARSNGALGVNAELLGRLAALEADNRSLRLGLKDREATIAFLIERSVKERKERDRTQCEPLAELGLSWPCTEDDVKREYKFRAARFHPDQFAGAGDKEAMATGAIKRLNAIRDAALQQVRDRMGAH